MKVSIVITITDKYLNGIEIKNTIDSILQQTYKDIELIIMDASRNNKVESLLKNILTVSSRVKVYETDTGISASLNQGFAMSTGDYFMKVDDNIILMPDTVERIMHIFERRKNIDFIYADSFLEDQRRENNEKLQYLNSELDTTYLYNPVRVCFIYKKKIQEVLKGYRQECIYDLNNDFWIRTKEARFTMYHVKGKLCYYILDTKDHLDEKNRFLDIRINMCKKAMNLCDLSVKMKMIGEILKQCKKYKRYKDYAFFAVYLEIVKKLSFINWQDKIIADSKLSFDVMADTYERKYDLIEVRNCYDPVLDIVRDYAPSDVKLLDVGCGTGVMLEHISAEFPNAGAIHGIDLSSMMVRKTNERLHSPNVYVAEGTLTTLDVPGDFYNILLCMHSFHHYPNPLENVKQMYRVLKKNGILILADNYYKGWKRISRNIELFKNNYPLGDMWMYSAGELFALTRFAGFKQQEFRRIGGSFIFICKK